MKLNNILTAMLCTAAIGATAQAQAGLITFEGLAIGTDVSTTFLLSDGVTFSSTTSGGGGPKVGGMGGPTLEGWSYNPSSLVSLPDTLLPTEGAANGARFITDIIGIKPATVNLTVAYSSAVAALSFDLFDIDGYQSFLDQTGGSSVESYLIEIFNSSNVLLDSISVTSGVALSGVATGVDSFGKLVGDGVVSRFGFSRGANEITTLKITGSRASGSFGLAFDNFSTNTFTNNVPEPASLALLGTGLLGLAFARRRKSA